MIGPNGDREGSGGESLTTNNRMELLAVINALRLIDADFPGTRPEIRTDSKYVKNGITAWIYGWKRNGWKTSDKKPVKNRELWENLDVLAQKTEAVFVWVEGHAGHAYNERCDELARMAILQL